MIDPFEYVSEPDLLVFGSEFQSFWVDLLAGLWGIAIIGCTAWLIFSFVTMNKAKARNNPHDLTESHHQVKIAAIAVAGCVAVPIIFRAIVALVS